MKKETLNERYYRNTGIDREAEEQAEDKRNAKKKKPIIVGNELTGF